MRYFKSSLGLILSVLYIIVIVIFIARFGFFGEAFIPIILGLPWTPLIALILSPFAESGGELPLIVSYIIYGIPLILNVIILYWIGKGIQKLFTRQEQINPL